MTDDETGDVTNDVTDGVTNDETGDVTNDERDGADDERDGTNDGADDETSDGATAEGAKPTYTPGEAALLVDDMLGKLATYLRMCGYDATYTTERGIETEADVLAKAHTEDRLVVTRDRELAARAERGVLLTAREVADQLRELREAGFELALVEEPARCSACNGLLERVDRTEPTPEYAPDPHEEAVWRCRECGQHFWKGSHWDDVAETLATL